MLKSAARVAGGSRPSGRDVFEAMRAVEGAKLLPKGDEWRELLAGGGSPGKRWRLVFTADTKAVQRAMRGGAGSGSYFPITAVQRWDLETSEIENGIFLGHVAAMTFKGPFSMKPGAKILAFDFTSLTFKVGPFRPRFSLTKDSAVKRAFDAAKSSEAPSEFQRKKASGAGCLEGTPSVAMDLKIHPGSAAGRALFRLCLRR